MTTPSVIVGMSGGVDSSIGAALLAEAGWDVVGVTLKLWCYGESDDEATPRSCCSLDAIADARSVALHMNFPHHVVDETEAFLSRLRLITHATSLGGVESLIERRARYAGDALIVGPTLCRFSVGIEDVEDLWTDLDRALRATVG